MNEYLLLFRMDITNDELQPRPEQMKVYMGEWTKWINEIAENGQLAEGGNHLSKQGRVLMPKNKMVDSPYISERESVAGYIIVLAENMDDATTIAKKCPILNEGNTSVEIREIAIPMEMI
jgi:hypothetical protein